MAKEIKTVKPESDASQKSAQNIKVTGPETSDNFRPTKAWSKLHDSVPISQRKGLPENARPVQDPNDPSILKTGKKPVSRDERVKSILGSVPNVYDADAHKKVREDLKAARKERADLKGYARQEQRDTLREDSHANAVVDYIIKKSGWAGLVHAIAKDEDEYGNKGHKKEIMPEARDLIKNLADELLSVAPEALTDKERVFMNVWNGQGEYDEAFSADTDVSDKTKTIKGLQDKSKQLTKDKAKQEKLQNDALNAAVGTGRHSVDIDISTPGQWRGFNVTGGGANAGYAMRVETDENGEKFAVGYNTFGDNQADTDRDPVYKRSLSDFKGSKDPIEGALNEFKTVMESNIGKIEGKWKGKAKKINEGKIKFAGDLLVGRDFDAMINVMRRPKVIYTIKQNGLVVDDETNTILRPEDLPEGHKARKVYLTDEETEELRKAGIPLESKYLGSEEGYIKQTVGAAKGGKVNGQTQVVKRTYIIDPKTGEKVYANKKSVREGNGGWNKAQTLKGASIGNITYGSDKDKEKLRSQQKRQDEDMNVGREAKQKAMIDNMTPEQLNDWNVYQALSKFGKL